MNPKTKILLIEDDKNISGFIAAALEPQNYKIVTASCGKEGISLAASFCPNVILLDLGLPDMDGLSVLRQIRGWSQVPVIVISAHTEEVEKVDALDMGADDYVTKPFGTAELTARIRASLRRGRKASSGASYKALDLEIAFDRHLVKLAGKDVHLTQIEYQLLTLLAENAGCVLTYRQIMNAIWGPYSTESNQILRVNMANIRRKIEAHPTQPQYVSTEIGIGYRMLENENP